MKEIIKFIFRRKTVLRFLPPPGGIVLRFIIFPPFLIIVFNFLEYGLVWKRLDQFIYPFILTMITYALFYYPSIRRLSLIISLALLLIMVFLYLANMLHLANIVGSFGLSLFLITLAIYLPQIIKKGYIEKF